MSHTLPRYFIVNPHAGGGVVGRKWAEIESRLRRRLNTFETHLTSKPGEAIELTRAALQRGTRHFVSVGGDGTNHEIVNGLIDDNDTIPDDVTLEFLPLGSGNDFLRSLAVSHDFDHVLDRLEHYHEKRVDIGKIRFRHDNSFRTRYFLSVAGTGFSANVNKMANEQCRCMGKFRYVSAFFPNLLMLRNTQSQIKIDGQEYDRKCCMTVVAHTSYFGGGMKIAPAARNDDGLFEVLLFRDFSAPELLVNFPLVFKGKHIHHPKIEFYKGSSIEIVTEEAQNLLADGEIIGQTPVEFNCLPGLLTIRI
ncbi:diacylglycerol kinase family lipid kinase [bacterium]|nr:diacylglycerol kinase family lipid kinase [bacterium]